MENDHVEDKESRSVTILGRHANTHCLRLREKLRAEEVGGAFSVGNDSSNSNNTLMGSSNESSGSRLLLEQVIILCGFLL